MNAPSKVHLSIVIPAFNEAPRIVASLRKIEQFLSQQSYSAEVIVVDDASNDRTVALIEEFIVGKPGFRLMRNENNVGKGGSVRRGMLEAAGEFRLFTDADLSTPIEEVQKFLQFVSLERESPSGFDVIIGSRRVKGSNVAKRQPFFREASGRIFSILVRLLTLRGFVDTQCGFKLFSARAAEEVFSRQTIDRFGFDVEILYIAKKKGFSIRETAVTWFDSPDTRVRLLRDAPQMFLDLLLIPLNGLLGKYS